MLNIQTGDLLFVSASLNRLSTLITKSTQTQASYNYVHVGLVEVDQKDGPFLLHADDKLGCVRQLLPDFLRHRGQVDLYRLKEEQIDFSPVLRRAKRMLASPYNPSFRSDQSGYYCSQFIYEAFRPIGTFKQTAMSFGPEGTILPAWYDYYRGLHLPVPNQEAGSSPNSLIEQNKLLFIRHLQ